jgi:hypothetical protein
MSATGEAISIVKLVLPFSSSMMAHLSSSVNAVSPVSQYRLSKLHNHE